jgi:Transglycosylase-like domain
MSARFLCRLAALACAVTAMAPAAQAAAATAEPTIVKRIQKYREETWRWQRLMRKPLTPTRRLAERTASESFRRWALAYWRAKAVAARRAALDPPRLAAWLCIHRHEGPWSADTGNGYYGGLQMDVAFQRTYGEDLLRAKGLAHRWLPLEQIWVAERAFRSGRGFSPWPSAARLCGLV